MRQKPRYRVKVIELSLTHVRAEIAGSQSNSTEQCSTSSSSVGRTQLLLASRRLWWSILMLLYSGIKHY